QWYLYLFKPVSSRLINAAMNLVEEERSSHVIDSALIGKLSSALTELKPDGIKGIKVDFRANLGVYTRFYERPYIFYAIRNVIRNTIHLTIGGIGMQYIERVLEGIEAEEKRAERYLSPDSMMPLKHMLNQYLINSIAEPIDSYNRLGSSYPSANTYGDLIASSYQFRSRIENEKISNAFQALLDEIFDTRDKNGLALMYRFFSRVKDSVGLAPLRERFELSIRSFMDKNRPSILDKDPNGALSAAEVKECVEWLLSVLDEHQQILADLFNNDVKFTAVFKEAYEYYINSVIPTKPIHKVPILLAEYCDSFLKANNEYVIKGEQSKGDVEEMLLDKAKHVFRIYDFCRDKDVFSRFYERHLARRLIFEQSYSSSLEAAVATMVRSSLSASIMANNTKVMQSDIMISEDLTDQFAANVHHNSSAALNMKVLQQGCWPLKASERAEKGVKNIIHITLPLELATLYDSFNKMYKKKHDGRVLNWIWSYSRVELKLYLPGARGAAAKSGYNLILNTYQATIIMLFNEESGPGKGYGSAQGPTLTCSQIESLTKLDEDEVRNELTTFIKAGILISVDKKKALDSSSSVRLNDRFRPKRTTINLSGTRALEKVKEIKNTLAQLEGDRQRYLEAKVVHVMKNRKRLVFKELQQIVAEKLAGYFAFTIKDFKSTLDSLIDREFLMRDEDNSKLFIYIS
ncbi:ubiquitin ligase (cullin) of SCF, partial [Dipsacomyces acuminosporus]